MVEKVRIVTFKGTKEQVEEQESKSRSFGSFSYNDTCEIIVEDATSVDLSNKKPFTFKYVNWKGEVGIRRVIPIQPKFEVNEFHGSEPLWLLKAYDLDKGAIRYFDMLKISEV